MKRKLFAGLYIAIPALLLGVQVGHSDYHCPAVSAGAETAADGYTLFNAGQRAIGVSSNGSITMHAGVIPCYVTASGPPAPGDCDADGDVDLADYTDFNSCFAGPGVGYPHGCECFDLDADFDIDLEDFAVFQVQFTGAL